MNLYLENFWINNSRFVTHQEKECYMLGEVPNIRKEKDSVVLLSDRYNTPSTNLLLFHFEPHLYTTTSERLKKCSLEHISIEGKDLYVFDAFFTEEEARELHLYSQNASFSKLSYGSQESREKGEEPARSMNNKERWEFLAKAPNPIKEIYKLLGLFSHSIHADISTLPWDICDQNICASAIVANRLERASHESMLMGKHEDFNTEKGIPFGIPILYKEKEFFPGSFINGAPGNPWLVSFMVYATEENFLSDYGTGTIFCNKDGTLASTVVCKHMRFVLFEGDILHSIEESHIPPQTNTWRVSYVFKLIINPREREKSMKKEFYNLMRSQF